MQLQGINTSLLLKQQMSDKEVTKYLPKDIKLGNFSIYKDFKNNFTIDNVNKYLREHPQDRKSYYFFLLTESFKNTGSRFNMSLNLDHSIFTNKTYTEIWQKLIALVESSFDCMIYDSADITLQNKKCNAITIDAIEGNTIPEDGFQSEFFQLLSTLLNILPTDKVNFHIHSEWWWR